MSTQDYIFQKAQDRSFIVLIISLLYLFYNSCEVTLHTSGTPSLLTLHFANRRSYTSKSGRNLRIY